MERNGYKDSGADEPSWGARINTRWGSKDYPFWANKLQREQWQTTGLVLWDSATHQITQLSALQASAVLEHLLGDDDWREVGLILGEPAFRLDGPGHQAEPVLLNEINLTPAQVHELLALLQNNTGDLKDMCVLEEQDSARRRHEVYRILLEDKVLNALTALYQQNPEEALKVFREAMSRVSGK